MRFRGREVTHPEIGLEILQRLFASVEEHAVIEAHPRLDGRQMTMVLAPNRKYRPETKQDETEAAAPEVPVEPNEADGDLPETTGDAGSEEE